MVHPKSWTQEIIIGLLLGCALKLALKAIVMPLLGADPINHAYHFVVGNPAAIPEISLIIVMAAFGEEILFRGYLFERLTRLLGRGAVMRTLVVLLTSLWFGMNHFVLMGFAGAANATLAGLVFGAIYAVTRRLGLLIVAHLAADSLAFAIIYFGLETQVAHWLYR